MKDYMSTKKVIVNSGIYAIASVFQKAISFLLLPLYTFYLNPIDYGIIGLALPLVNLLSVTFTLSLEGAVTRFYSDYKNDTKKLQEFFGTVISFVAINSIVIGALIILLKDYLLSSYIESVPFYPYFLLSILIAIVNPIYTIYQTILRTKQEAKEHAINSSLNFLLLILFNVIFIAILKIGAVGQLLSYLITGFLFSVWSIYRLLRRKVIKIVQKKIYLMLEIFNSIDTSFHV